MFRDIFGITDTKRNLLSRTPSQKCCPLADPVRDLHTNKRNWKSVTGNSLQINFLRFNGLFAGCWQNVHKQVLSVACFLLEAENKARRLNCGHVFRHTITLSCSNAEDYVQNVDNCECFDAWLRLDIRRPVCEICNQRSTNNTIKNLMHVILWLADTLFRVMEEQQETTVVENTDCRKHGKLVAAGTHSL